MDPRSDLERRFDRARKHFRDCEALIFEYNKSGEGAQFDSTYDPENKTVTWRVIEFDDPPDEIADLVTDTLFNLHSCLDHVVTAIARKHVKSGNDRDFGFPIARTSEGLQRQIDQKIGRLPEEVKLKIAAMEPFEAGAGGNLWLLNTITNVAKHRRVVDVKPALSRIFFGNILHGAEVKMPHPVILNLGDTVFFDDGTFRQFDPVNFFVVVSLVSADILPPISTAKISDFFNSVSAAIRNLDDFL